MRWKCRQVGRHKQRLFQVHSTQCIVCVLDVQSKKKMRICEQDWDEIQRNAIFRLLSMSVDRAVVVVNAYAASTYTSFSLVCAPMIYASHIENTKDISKYFDYRSSHSACFSFANRKLEFFALNQSIVKSIVTYYILSMSTKMASSRAPSTRTIPSSFI